MKKQLLALGIVLLLAACNNGDMKTKVDEDGDKDEDDYDIHSGVYPYEVNATYEFGRYIEGSYDWLIRWEKPTNKNYLGLYLTEGRDEEELQIISGPENVNSIAYFSSEFNQTYVSGYLHYFYLQCIDKYGNVSKGIMLYAPGKPEDLLRELGHILK